MNSISPDLDHQIRQTIRYCGQQIKQLTANQFEVFQKGPEDYVTTVDAALDRQLSAAFSTLFPDDGVITEENAKSRQQFQVNYSRFWCIDPLDGTEDFIDGKHDYAVMVGLLQDYQPIAGWLYAPTSDQMYYGGANWGLFQAIADYPSMALPIVQPPPLNPHACPIVLGYRDQLRYGQAIAELIPAARFYSLGSFGLKVLEVICGHAGLYTYLNRRVKLWDTTGPIALAKAAGLICCDLDGNPLQFSPEAIDRETLTHRQTIVVGWPEYIHEFLPKLKQAFEQTATSDSSAH